MKETWAIVAGGRDYRGTEADLEWIKEICARLEVVCVIHGGARGADQLGHVAAHHLGLRSERYPARWSMHGKAAGPIRNRRMAEDAQICLLFPGGKGTANMRKEALARGLQVFEYPSLEPVETPEETGKRLFPDTYGKRLEYSDEPLDTDALRRMLDDDESDSEDWDNTMTEEDLYSEPGIIDPAILRRNISLEIQEERTRQVILEDYSPEHDLEHDDASLADAAACYAAGRPICEHQALIRYGSKELWPWEPESDKRGKQTRIRELIKAGALIHAELERLVRKKRAEEAPGETGESEASDG